MSNKKTSLLQKIKQGSIVSSVIAGNSIIRGGAVSLLGVTKVFNSSDNVNKKMVDLANDWISTNNQLINKQLPDLNWDIYIDPNLDLHQDGHYMMTCNHQSWVDTTVNQYFVRPRMPMTRFFIKWELLFVPFAGTAFKALGFPAMKRYDKKKLEKNPELKQRDFEEARKSCEQLLNTPFTLLNYLEGTRLTAEKHKQQKSPYTHLLKPKAGGLALALKILANKLDALVDMTIVYEDKVPSYSDFWLGETSTVRIHIRKIDIPEWVNSADYNDDPEYRQKFQQWVDAFWKEKDALIEQIKQQKTAQISIETIQGL